MTLSAIKRSSSTRTSLEHPLFLGWHVLLAVLMVTMVIGIARAPEEVTMGDAQRILYLHVAVAWLGLLGFICMAATSVAYLLTRRLDWDHWSQSAGELGWVCCSLTLITGSLWAHAAWGTWWTWDPRLLSSFVLWSLYSGCLLLRGNLVDDHQRARLVSVVALLGAIDVPLVIMATRWFRGMHPVAPQMETGMRLVLLFTAMSLTSLVVTLCVRRRNQLRLEQSVSQLELRGDLS